MLVALAAAQVACHQPPAETSFGVEGTRFNCVDERCDIVFLIDNQLPDAVKIQYRAVLADSAGEAIVELVDELLLPPQEKTRVSRTVTVAVSEQPTRLRVSVTTLQGV